MQLQTGNWSKNSVFFPVLRIRDVYPGSRILIFTHPGSRISDPGSKNSNKRERWKKISCHTFLCSHKFHKIVNYFSFEVLKKKIWANFQRIIELLTKKIVKKFLKIWSWDPGSGKNLFRIPDPGVKKHPIPDPGSGSATLFFSFWNWFCMVLGLDLNPDPEYLCPPHLVLLSGLQELTCGGLWRKAGGERPRVLLLLRLCQQALQHMDSLSISRSARINNINNYTLY